MKTQITISQLERILNAAKRAQKSDNSLSETIELEVTSKVDTHLGGDMIAATLKSAYSECNGEVIFWNK